MAICPERATAAGRDSTNGQPDLYGHANANVDFTAYLYPNTDDRYPDADNHPHPDAHAYANAERDAYIDLHAHPTGRRRFDGR